jgi:Resolvase, N terminal domain
VRRVLQPGFDDSARHVVVYCRVSSPGQKDDLAAQVTAMEQFCLGRGLAVDEWVQETGGGMNLRRTKFLALMDAIEQGHQRRQVRPAHRAGRTPCPGPGGGLAALRAGTVVAEDLTRTFTGRRRLGRVTNRRLAAWTKGLTAEAWRTYRSAEVLR